MIPLKKKTGINIMAASFIMFVDCVCCCWKVVCIYRLLKVPLVPFVMDSMPTLLFSLSLTHSLYLYFSIFTDKTSDFLF